MSIKITDCWNTELMATIDLGAFLNSTLDKAPELEAMVEAMTDDDGNIPGGPEGEPWDAGCEYSVAEYLAEKLNLEKVCSDNSYNYENDLSDDFNYTILSDSDEWYYSQKTLIILRRHLGGDPRGNYAGPEIFRLNTDRECAFIDRTVGWSILEGIDKDGKELTDSQMREMDESWETGYSSNPTYQFHQTVEVVHSHCEDSADVTLKNGYRVKVCPTNWNID